MAIENPDIIISPNGSYVEVLDPDAAADTFGSAYRRVPGAQSVQLPDDQPQNNEVVSLQGVGQAAAFARLGTISIPINRYIPYHPTMQMLRGKRGTKNKVLARYTFPQEKVGVISGAGHLDHATDSSLFVLAAGKRNEATRLIQVGMMVTLNEINYVIFEVVDTDGVMTGVRIATNTGALPAADIGAANAPEDLSLVIPQMVFSGLRCSVNGLGDGNSEAEGSLSSNLVLAPATKIGNPDLVLA